MPLYPLITEKQTFFDANSNELSGGKLFIYQANTTTKVTTFAETDGFASNSNPIILNSRGEVPNGLYVAGGIQYKLVLTPSTDTDPPTSPIWTRDDLDPLGYVSPTALSEWQSSGSTATQISATSFTVPGDARGVFQFGRRVRAVVTAAPQLTYGTIITSSFGAGVTTVTLSPLTTNLDAGLTGTVPDVGLLSATNPSVPWYLTLGFTAISVAGTASFANGTWSANGIYVASATTNLPTLVLENSTIDANASSVALYKSRNGLTTNNGDTLGSFFGYGRDSGNFPRIGGYMRFSQNGVAGATWVPGSFALQLTNGGGTDTNVLNASTSAFNVVVPLQENATRVFSRNAAFVSAEQTVTNNSVTPVGHGFVGIPTLATLSLRCKTADIGYAVGDEVDLTFYSNAGGVVQLCCDTTNCSIIHNNSINLVNKGAPGTISSITTTSWRWVVRAWY